jgi:hypothetical protein
LLPIVQAQDTISVYKRKNSFLLGLTSSNGPLFVHSDGYYILTFGGAARLGYFPAPRFAVLAQYHKYSWVSNIIDARSLSGGRISGRYYWKGFQSGIYSELGYMLNNKRFPSEITKVTNEINDPSHYLTIGSGVSLKFARNFYLNMYWQGAISLNGKGTRSLYDRSIFSVDYIFNSDYKDKPMLKSKKSKDVELGGKRKFQLATGGFIFPFRKEDFGERYNEYLWTSKAGYYFNKSITGGLMTGLILGQPEVTKNRFFYFAGPYLNVKMFPTLPVVLYLETGYNYSNLSIPEVGLPRNSTTHYVNAGGGLNYKIGRDLYIDAALVLQNCVGGTQKCEGGSSIIRFGLEYIIR